MMRTWLPVLFLIFPVLVSGQVEQRVQQRLDISSGTRPSGCYESLKIRGLDAQQSGRSSEAERLFREAMNCPEARRNEEFRSELQILIARCESVRKAGQATEGSGVRGKGRYKPDRNFLAGRDPDCFESTRQEADRAFSGKFWEDAAALYRAAKSCADADQSKRQAMNDRIEICRLEAENELLQKERNAVWQARQAIASNKADDAKALLIKGDRTRAYRLADFANAYIAPADADNPDCLQAMFDAWYFDPAVHAYYGSPFKVPFCYQLTGDLGDKAQIRFTGQGEAGRIFVFAPERHSLQIWRTANLQPDRSVPVDTSFRTFDVLQDGRTILFESKEGYTLWRNNSQFHRIPLPEGRSYVIDEDGRQFHYYDPETRSIQTLTVQDVFGSAKAYQMQRSASTRQRVSGLSPGLLAFRFNYPELWLLYADRVEVLKKQRSEDRWRRAQTWSVGGLSEMTQYGVDNHHFYILPEAHRIRATNNFETLEWFLPDQQDSIVEPESRFPGRLLGMSPDYMASAYWQYAEQSNSYFVSIAEQPGAFPSFNMLSPADDYLAAQNGAFSPDMQWFGVAGNTGTVKLWRLDNSSNTRVDSAGNALVTALSPNGDWAVFWEQERIGIYKADKLDQAAYELPRPEANMPEMVHGDRWLVYRRNMDTVGLWNWTDSIHRYLHHAPSEVVGVVTALDEENDLIACNMGDDSVEVRSLLTGKLIAAHRFEGMVEHLAFIPGTDELLVVQNIARSLFSEVQVIPKLWSFQAKSAQERVIRLHGSSIYYLDIRKDGRMIAFADDRSIRLYSLDNLLDEALVLRQIGNKYITAIRFHPDGQSLAAAYNDGTVIFWDARSGRVQFQFTPVAGTETTFIRSLSISEDGSFVRCNTDRGHYITRLLSPDVIREQAQDNYRQLEAFTPEEIRDYDLASALDYPGNFERLAASGDRPLIRAFFDYYHAQAIGSNNISRLRDYCDKAFRLYIQLDETARQDLRSTMLDMYADFAWKLILRNRIEEATRVTQTLETYFGDPVEALLVRAHTALLNNDFSRAARYYTDWSVRNREENPYYEAASERLQTELLQLAEYGLLNTPQAGYICAMYGPLLDLGSLCNRPATMDFADTETRLRWSVFMRLDTAGRIWRHNDRIFLLQGALKDAQELRKRYPGRSAGLAFAVLEALAEAGTTGSGFEQNAPQAVTILQDLDRALRAADVPDTYRSAKSWLEAKNALALGAQYLMRGSLDSAMSYFNQAQVVARDVHPANDEEREQFRNDLMGQLWTQTGLCYLARNQPGEARMAFDKANESLTYGLNTLYLGHAAALEGNSDAAMEHYEGIFTEEQLGLAAAQMEEIAVFLPAMKKKLRLWSSLLLDSLAGQKIGFDRDAVRYYYALQKINSAAYRLDWAEALHWSDFARTSAEAMLNKDSESFQWRENWLDAHINQSYYLLFSSMRDTASLSRVIRYSLAADTYIEGYYPDFPHRSYLYTNLAHAYWLRNQPGDREQAVRFYQTFLNDPMLKERQVDGWETLQKDFRDLFAAGVRWPDLPDLLKAIVPSITISEKEWREMGQEPSINQKD